MQGSCENQHRGGRRRETDVLGDREIPRCVKRNRRQTLVDITREINERLPSLISSRMAKMRLRFFLISQEGKQVRH